MAVPFHCLNVPHCVYSLISWWTVGWVPFFGYYESCCYDHSCQSVYVDVCFHFSQKLLGHMVILLLHWCKNCQTTFQRNVAFSEDPFLTVLKQLPQIAHHLLTLLHFPFIPWWNSIEHCIYLLLCDTTMRVLVTQSCPTLCDPMDCSLPGFSVRGILQARILEWIARYYNTWHIFICCLCKINRPTSWGLKLICYFSQFHDEMVGWHHWLDGHGFGWTPGVGDGQGGLACCCSWGGRVWHD